jgi:hypothetical protein
VLYTSQYAVRHIATNGANVYLTENHASGLSDLWVVPAHGGAAVSLQSGVSVDGLAASSGTVYWKSGSGVWKLPQTGGPATQVSTSQAVADIAGDDDGVFAFDYDDNQGVILVTESR